MITCLLVAYNYIEIHQMRLYLAQLHCAIYYTLYVIILIFEFVKILTIGTSTGLTCHLVHQPLNCFLQAIKDQYLYQHVLNPTRYRESSIPTF